jgi:hypothetical protein
MDDTTEVYQAPADIAGYGEDRVGCGPLSLFNLLGLVVGMLAVWKLTGWLGLTGPNFSPAWWLQVVLIGASGIGGALCTARMGGLAPLERAVLWVNFHLERLTGGSTITPHAPGASAQRTRGALVIERDGQVLSAPYQEHSHE